MKCEGYYEAELIDKDGEVVEYWKSKNKVLYGFIGGLFHSLFGVGTSNGNGTIYDEKGKFGRLYLFSTAINANASNDPAATDSDNPTNWGYETTQDKGWKDLTAANKIQSQSVTFETAPSTKITLTFQVSFGPSEALYSNNTQTTWHSMGIGSIPIVALSNESRLVTRVKMGTGILKTNSQTLRVRYNFSIIVS